MPPRGARACRLCRVRVSGARTERRMKRPRAAFAALPRSTEETHSVETTEAEDTTRDAAQTAHPRAGAVSGEHPAPIAGQGGARPPGPTAVPALSVAFPRGLCHCAPHSATLGHS